MALDKVACLTCVRPAEHPGTMKEMKLINMLQRRYHYILQR